MVSVQFCVDVFSVVSEFSLLHFSFSFSMNTLLWVQEITLDICKHKIIIILINYLKNNYNKCLIFQSPSSVEEWNEIGNNFGLRWNCPDCYGAIYGKHIVIKAPANSGSDFFLIIKDHLA